MNNLIELCNEYRENKRLIEELQAMNDAIKADIITAMNGQEVVIAGNNKISNTLVHGSKFDTGAFKTAYPDIYPAYVKSNNYRRFTIV